jgi:hypothetical protein
MKYLLLDTNVVAAYYLPHSNKSAKLRDRAKQIFDAKRSEGEELFFYLPNFCVAEVFSVFMKHSFSSWNRHVKSTIDTRIYKRLVDQFQSDIHNASLIYHYELSRYHVLGVNLVAPVDHYFQFSRQVNGKKKNLAPMGTYDHMIISMGIQLTRIHGQGNVSIISGDDRLINILKKCRTKIPEATIKKLRLDKCQEITGIPFRPEVFPVPLNLKDATSAELREFFGRWPLEIRDVPKHYRYVKP